MSRANIDHKMRVERARQGLACLWAENRLYKFRRALRRCHNLRAGSLKNHPHLMAATERFA